jgi:curli biogenesis system outer membrane secretion channel CsgG
MTRLMNQTTLVVVAALAVSALIMATAGILQPAAATQIQSNQEIKQGLAQCNFKGSSCTGNYQQAANTIIFSHTS